MANPRQINRLVDAFAALSEGKPEWSPDVIHLGRAVVREIVDNEEMGCVARSFVTQGVITRGENVSVIREGSRIAPAPGISISVVCLKRSNVDQSEVCAGFECDIRIGDYHDFRKGDVIEAYREK